MKNIKYYLGVLFVSLVLFMASCSDMNDLHKQYLENGETIYTSKLDSLSVYTGKYRVKICGIIENAFGVDEIVVSWAKGEKDQIFPFTKSGNIYDSLELIVTDLEEKSHSFKIYSRDKDGNKSLESNIFATVYGDEFKNVLENRAVKAFAFDGVNAVVKFAKADDLTRFTVINYTDNSETEVIDTLDYNEYEVSLLKFDMQKSFTYSTFYVPTLAVNGEETTIDLFDSKLETYKLPSISSILESIEVTPILGGVEINWKNPDEKNIKVSAKFIGLSGSVITKEIESNEAEAGVSFFGMANGTQDIEISIADFADNSLGPVIIPVTPITAKKLDKSGWSILGVSSEQNDAAGAFLAAHVIDDNLITYWRTPGGEGAPTYPHWMSVDMGKDCKISMFEIFRRPDNQNSPFKFQLFYSIDGTTWIEIGKYDFNPDLNAGQIYGLPPVTARYFKYVGLEGRILRCLLGEINVYGE